MKKLAIHIVEDESIIAQDLSEILEELGHTITGVSTSYQDVILKLPFLNADFFFLDIILKEEKTGIDVAKELIQRNLPFIFISSITERGMIDQVRETAPYGFIIKPFNENDIFISLEMAISRLNMDLVESSIFINIGSGKERVLLNTIEYAQADGNYTDVFVNDRKFTINENLKTVHANLLNHSPFKRVHKSYLVNVNCIVKVLKNTILLSSGVEIPKNRHVKFD